VGWFDWKSPPKSQAGRLDRAHQKAVKALRLLDEGFQAAHGFHTVAEEAAAAAATRGGEGQAAKHAFLEHAVAQCHAMLRALQDNRWHGHRTYHLHDTSVATEMILGWLRMTYMDVFESWYPWFCGGAGTPRTCRRRSTSGTARAYQR
jgi:hypothetical protein